MSVICSNDAAPVGATRVKTWTLYPWLLLWVLSLAGCGAQQSGDTTPAADTTATETTSSSVSEADASSDVFRVVVLGNSLAAGYGLDPEQAFPALLQQKVDSLGWNVTIQNAGVSGETTAGGLRRIDWLLRERVDVLVLELGGNDGLRGIDPEVTKENLQAIIDKTKAAYPDARIVLAGMQVPTNLGPQYTQRFRDLYPELSEENDAALIPFLLQDVGGIPSLNQPDGIHPTAKGHEIVAETVWETLKPVLQSMRQPA